MIKYAYYNEHDPFAAEWLRKLIAAGLIAPGEVDERDVKDVQVDDLQGFWQHHLFAGVGVWSYALRRAGWPDDRPIVTGSCPCQPFSTAGKQAKFEDSRHLWPEFFRLVRQLRPAVVVGEQVASPAGLEWLDVVLADLEGAGYAVGAADLCAAGVGAPHIRQRLYWVGHSREPGGGRHGRAVPRAQEAGCGPRIAARDIAHQPVAAGAARELGHSLEPRREGRRPGVRQLAGDADPHGQEVQARSAGSPDRMADPDRPGLGGPRSAQPARRIGDAVSPGSSPPGAVANSHGRQPSDGELQRGGRLVQLAQDPLAGFWSGAEWVPCTDGKWRPVESRPEQMAAGAASLLGYVRSGDRVVLSPLIKNGKNRTRRLRGYGNSLCAPVAEAFMRVVMEHLDSEKTT
jgi:DNA (cytosine-5)-methyltransferase 1